MSRIKKVGLLFSRTGRHKHSLRRNAVADRNHSLYECFGRVYADTAHLACRSHVDSEHRVSALQTREAELRSLDADIIEVKSILRRFLDRQTEHDACCKVDEINLEHLRHKWETARRTKVTFDNLDVVVLGKELDVERAGDFESLCDLA